MTATSAESIDVLVVGAGLSGIAAGYYLQQTGRSYTIVEAGAMIGGTWSGAVHNYPAIRSDSDLFTFGYSFFPWSESKVLADGPSIKAYIIRTAQHFGIDKRIQFRHRVRAANWDSKQCRWLVTVDVAETGAVKHISAGFLFTCTGYYDYENPHFPDFPGAARFRGRIVHPQLWTDDVIYESKRVVVIGSGATAVTLVPALAKKAARVTMLQRTPTWIASMPAHDSVAAFLQRILPASWVHSLLKWRNVLFGVYIFQLCRFAPKFVGNSLLKQIRQQLGDDYPVEKHFAAPYNPWEQRLCLVPDNDFFKAIKNGNVEVVTDTIATLTETGVTTSSGLDIPADLIVSATGLRLKVFGGIQLSIDGAPVDQSQHFMYKGMMLSGVPNLAWTVGYTNASWTLKADLTTSYLVRILNFMDDHGHAACVPKPSIELQEHPLLNLSSGYITRNKSLLPKSGHRTPWKVVHNYLIDWWDNRFSKVDDGELQWIGRAPVRQFKHSSPSAAAPTLPLLIAVGFILLVVALLWGRPTGLWAAVMPS